jgi:hypothetical protein
MASRDISRAADDLKKQARPYVNDVENNLLPTLRSYANPAATSVAALGFFMSGQARLVPLITGNRTKVDQENSDDGIIPLLSRLGVRFSEANASSIIGLIKMSLAIGLAYYPTRRPAARWAIAYTALGLISRVQEGITLTPSLINMALLSIPAQFFDSV